MMPSPVCGSTCRPEPSLLSGCVASPESETDPPPIPAQPVDPSHVLSYADPFEEQTHANRVLMEHLPCGGVSFLFQAPGVLREMGSIVTLSLTLSASLVLLMYASILPCGVVAGLTVLMIFAVVRSAMQPSMIEVRDGVLTQVSPVSLIKPKQQWPCDSVKQLRVSWRGISITGRAVADLDMTLTTGRTVQLYAGRDRRELLWIAHHLRNAMHLEDPASQGATVPRANL